VAKGYSTPEEFDIFEAVFRHQFQTFISESNGLPYDYFFVAIPTNQDPPPGVLMRFAGNSPPVEPVSASAIEELGSQGVSHKIHGGRGVIFHVTKIRRLDDATAQVEGGFYMGNLGGLECSYRLEQRGGRWVVADRRVLYTS
jgi:hypothetical protein